MYIAITLALLWLAHCLRNTWERCRSISND